MAAQGVGAVITGNVGPNAHKRPGRRAASPSTRSANGVTAHAKRWPRLRRGELTAVEAPTVSGHWTREGMEQP